MGTVRGTGTVLSVQSGVHTLAGVVKVSRVRKLVSRATGKAGDMAQWLKLLAAFPEDQKYVPSKPLWAAHSHL